MTSTTMATWPTMTVPTAYGDVVLSVWAGPTSCPGTGHLQDHEYPSAAHAFGRDPEPYSLGVSSVYDGPHLTINGIDYRVNVWFYCDKDGRPGWAESYAGGIVRPVLYGIDADPTDGARKVWRERINPAIIAALNGPDGQYVIGAARAEAADRFRESVAERIAALRAEADRLEAIA